MLNFNFVFLFFLISCGTTADKTAVVSKPSVDPIEFKNKCIELQDALSCARYGYITKEITFTKEACRLGDEPSCFNVQEVENRAPNQNLAIISSHQGQIYGCYVNHSIDFDNGEGLKADKELDLFFQIDEGGKLTSMSISGKTISEKFKECVMSSFTSRKFIGIDRPQNIRYALVMPAVTRDRRLDKGRPKLLD